MPRGIPKSGLNNTVAVANSRTKVPESLWSGVDEAPMATVTVWVFVEKTLGPDLAIPKSARARILAQKSKK